MIKWLGSTSQVKTISRCPVVGQSPWRKQGLRADSLDSSDEEEEGGGARNDSMCSSDEVDESKQGVWYFH